MPKPLEALALPGKFLLGKITEFKKQQQEQSRRKVTERELAHLHHKIDKLLVRLEEHELEPAQSQDEECAICISAKATMQTFPCGHRVVCRKCFVKTIQMAVSQRLLPLRCVICRAKILRLKQLSGGHQPVTEAMPRSFISCGPSKMGFVGYANSKLSQPLGDLAESKRPLPMPPSRVQPFRSRRSGGTTRPLVPIPETEELEIVHSVRDVQQDDFCSDLGHEVWTMDEDLKLIPKEKKPIQKNGRWWSRFYRCRLAAPALIKSIRKKCK